MTISKRIKEENIEQHRMDLQREINELIKAFNREVVEERRKNIRMMIDGLLSVYLEDSENTSPMPYSLVD